MNGESTGINYHLRNRKVRRSIDELVARQSYIEILSLGAVFCVILSSQGFVKDFSRLSNLLGGLLLGVSLLRGILVFYFNKLYAHGARVWFRRFVFVVYIHVGLWSIVSCLVAFFSPDIQEILLVMVANVGLAATTSLAWSRLFRANLGRLTLLMVPTPVAVIFSLDPLLVATGFLILCSYLVLLHQTEVLNKQFWTMVESHRQLDGKSRELESMVSEVQQAAQLKSHFISNITREVRTPMTNVVGMLALLEDTGLTDDQARLQAIAMQSSEALLSLIDDILDFSRLRAGTLSLGAVVYEVREAAEDAIELVAPQAYERGLELALVIDSDVPTRVRSDRVRFMQLLRYLMLNAVDGSVEGEVVVRLRCLSLSDEKVLLRIEITDQGKGITAEQQQFLFEPFANENSDLQGTQALGLGLPLAKGLVERMNGTIGVDSQPGVGTMFWIDLPLPVSSYPIQPKSLIDLHDHQRILLINAGTGMIASVREYLSGLPITLDTIEGDERTWLRMQTAADEGLPYDLVIYNVSPRGFDGTQLLKKIGLKWTDLPIVIMCSLEQRGDSRLLLLANDVERVTFVRKPIIRSRALSVVQTVMQGDRRPKTETGVVEQWHDDISYRVLVVENNKVNQLVIAGMLANLGYRVSLASSGIQALLMMEERVFSLILMDLLMPEMDGFETTAQIRQTDSIAKTPIIAMTANTEPGIEAKCIAAGMNDYITKPILKSELAAKTRRWLGTDVEREGVIVIKEDKA